jgi:putative phage-type endonuclease
MFTETATAERRAWLEERRTGLGASDVAAIFGVSPYKSALALYHEKRGDLPIPDSEREALYWGRMLEEPIAARYADETGRRVERCPPYEIRRHPTHPFLIATLDAVASAAPGLPPPAGGPGTVEIKNAGFFRRDQWRDEPPLAFLIQANHQMAVTGFEWASLAALVGGSEFFWTDLARNNAFIEVLIRKAGEFWQRVRDGVPPEVDGGESTKQLLKALYPRDTGGVVHLGPEWVALDDELLGVKAEQKKLEDRRGELEAKLRYAMGDATTAVLDNGGLYTLKTTKRREFISPASEFRVLRRTGD